MFKLEIGKFWVLLFTLVAFLGTISSKFLPECLVYPYNIIHILSVLIVSGLLSHAWCCKFPD